jgi:hypothetical protein
MNHLKFSLCLLLLFVTIRIYGQQVPTCKLNVDSLFESYFFSLDTTVECSTSKLISSKDIEFTYLLGYLSGINYNIQSYSGHPILTVQDVVNFKKWYRKNKFKISCDRIEKGLLLLRKGLTDDVSNELEKLKIE